MLLSVGCGLRPWGSIGLPLQDLSFGLRICGAFVCLFALRLPACADFSAHVILPAILEFAARVAVDLRQGGLKFDRRLTHPVLGPDVLEPVLNGWNTTAVFLDMLLADPSHGNHPARAVPDRMTEDPFALEDALGMMPERPMAEVGHELFRGIEPVVDCLVVLGHPSPAFCAAAGMMVGVCHT